jgi:LPPG:FO 2-phospho-L-lactate transferase
MKIVALAGGVGGAKLLVGLAQAMNPSHLTAIVNTGDDIALHGLHVSPDLDTATYTLAGAVNRKTGWGLAGESFRALELLKRYRREGWFNLGDRDLGTHIHRTALLRSGASLAQVTDAIRRAWRVRVRILPMSDQRVTTMIRTRDRWMHFQEYFVRLRTKPVVAGIRFDGARAARPAPGVLAAIAGAERIIICPSNPLISIGPILAVPGIRNALRTRRDDTVAVSPIVGGKSLKGPSDRMMRQLGYDCSAAGVAQLYADIAGAFAIDRSDARQARKIEALGMRVIVANTVMRTPRDKVRLARELLA